MSEPKMTPIGEAFVRADDYGFDKMIETLEKLPDVKPPIVTECAGDKSCDCHESADKTFENYP